MPFAAAFRTEMGLKAGLSTPQITDMGASDEVKL